MTIENALRQTGIFGSIGRGEIFKAVFGGTTLTHNPTQEYFNDKAIGGRTVDAHNITFYDAAFDTRPISFKYNVAHEFGHAFNNLVGNQLAEDLAGGIPVTLENGTIDTNTIPGGIGVNYIRSNDGYQLEDELPYPYQQNTTRTAAEESGDMFSNWSFNSFANNVYGDARYSWMDSNMDIYLPLAVAANQ